MTTSRNLIDWVAGMREEGVESYLLIDTAHTPNSHSQLDRWMIPYISLFDQTTEKSLVEIAPLFIPMRNLSVESVRRVCDWAIDLAYGAPCLSWIASPLPAAKLAAHLRMFHLVSLTDSQTMMLRWYDTRILPVWMLCLDPAQAAQFTAGIKYLSYINRFGEGVVLHNSEVVATLPDVPSLSKPLINLTDRQFGMLLDGSQADTLVSHLRRIITDETNLLSGRVLFKFVAQYQQRAVEAGINDLDRQTQYLLLAIYTSGKGADHSTCEAFIKEPPESLEGFSAGLQALPDAVWNAGEPLWNAKRGIAPSNESQSLQDH